MSPYAKPEVCSITLIGAAATLAAAWYFGWLALVPALLTLALLSFYRHPRRTPPIGDRLVVSPADGKVVSITRNVPGESGTPELRIMVFLSVFNVHINRSPCGGRVLKSEYKPGLFLNALSAEADTRNEANTLTLQPSAPLPGPIRVRQIAGVLARRIVCAAKPGDSLTLGEPMGMIKLGSRTELVVPEDPRWVIAVKLGQAVKGGLTIMARLSDGT
ncbi:phosphatidylserine decarboxylase [Phycisphaerae bacterium RAS1]|nr:phosphatidylserine decarboxylase [Phycisphaerae bacterium RAS1]